MQFGTDDILQKAGVTSFTEVDVRDGEDEFLASHPDEVEIPCTITTEEEYTAYIVKCRTPNGRIWATAKRFSEFNDLRAVLTRTYGAEAVNQLTFPEKTWFGRLDNETVQSRKATLDIWINGVLKRFPGDRHVSMFLAPDGSVGKSIYNQLGIPILSSRNVDGASQKTLGTAPADDGDDDVVATDMSLSERMALMDAQCGRGADSDDEDAAMSFISKPKSGGDDDDMNDIFNSFMNA